jgi:hypothetical protein
MTSSPDRAPMSEPPQRCATHGHFMTFCRVCQTRYCRTCGHEPEECGERTGELVNKMTAALMAETEPPQRPWWRKWR